MFQSEMFSQQQILHSIVSEGHQMMEEGSIENRVEFEKKLSLLDSQWQSVVRRVNQRKAIIDNNTSQWRIYQYQLERLQVKMADINQCLEALNFQTAPVQRIRMLLENVKVC